MLLLSETPETLGVVDAPPWYQAPPKPQPSMYLPTISEENCWDKYEVDEEERECCWDKYEVDKEERECWEAIVGCEEFWASDYDPVTGLTWHDKELWAKEYFEILADEDPSVDVTLAPEVVIDYAKQTALLPLALILYYQNRVYKEEDEYDYYYDCYECENDYWDWD